MESETGYRWRWIALFVILAGEILDMLDALVTNIAAPTMRQDLGGSSTLLQWLGAGYTLAMAVGLITGGRLGDLYGRKRMFLIGASGFTLGSLLCALAQDPQMLIAFRVLQGLFGAMMLPQGIGMIKEMFPPEQMARAFGAFGPIMGLSSVGGPILAGWLIDADLFGTGWRMIFLINLPLGLAAVLVGLRYLPRSRVAHASRLDPIGMVLAGIGAVLLVYPLVQGRELGWPAWTLACMAGSAVVFAVFGWHQARRQRRGADPLIVPSLFRKRGFSGGLVVGLAFFSSLAGFSLIFSLFVQLGLGYSPLKSGLSGVPLSIGMIIGFGVAQAVASFGRKVIQAGTVIAILGLLALVLTLHLNLDGVTPWQLSPALAVLGLGMGLLMAPFFDIVLGGVEPAETGSAGGTLTAVQQLGSAVGVALLGTVFFGVLGGHVTGAADHQAPALRAELTHAQVVPARQDALVTGLRGCAHDRAVASDLGAQPASCQRVRSTVASVAARHPSQARRVTGAVAKAEKATAHRGFSQAMAVTLWVVLGLLAATLALVFLLPRQARPERPDDAGAPSEEPAVAPA